MKRLLTVAEMTLRELARRRGVIALLLLLPLAFYLIRRDQYIGQSIRSLFIGIGWAVSTAALFSTIGARSIEPRLRLAGYRAHDLYLGRLVGLWTLGVLLAAPFLLLVSLDTTGLRYGAISLAMLCCVVIAAPLGMLVGYLLPREMEGTLLLLTAVALQMIIDPATTIAKVTPFWSSREIGTYAVDNMGTDYLVRGSVHGIAATLVMLALVAVVSSARLRRRPHLRQV
ncbi:hypothetical protein GCM10009682_34110 [Luedemannella flava]|uniref:ABC transporter permease n=1 Tax=Luedemannella flava TaxID=349316 RepID=A0ABP4YEG2_9ACTN